MQKTKNRLSSKTIQSFQKKIYAYYNSHGRDLPWRRTSDPYHILVSEIMLQQTQVDRVIGKYVQFIKTFPTIQSLAKSPVEKVLKAWQGLGYNRRALMVQKCAQHIVQKHRGVVPNDPQKLVDLPGIGKATAAAICVYAFHQPLVYIETNIRSLFIHEFFADSTTVTDEQLLPLIQQTLDAKQPFAWYSALMDYGTHIKKSMPNPSRRSARHTKQSRFEGSDRQIRGRVIKLLLARKKLSFNKINAEIKTEPDRLHKIILGLATEGFIKHSQKSYAIDSRA